MDFKIKFAKIFNAEIQILTLYSTPLKTINRKADLATTSAYNLIKEEGITVYQDSINTSNITAVVNVSADEMYINPETDSFELEKANLLAYSHGKYYALGEKLGFFGYSVEKKKRKR